jgi:hypothetical protein
MKTLVLVFLMASSNFPDNFLSRKSY